MNEPFFKSGKAQWIWSAEGTHQHPEKQSPSHYEERRFRRVFELATTQNVSLEVAVSADSRFILYCNGNVVSRGPSKGNVQHQFYSIADLTPHLQSGTNILAALVMDFSPVRCDPPNLGAPCWSITSSGGFLLDCLGMPELATASDWEVQVDPSFEFHNEGCPHGGFVGYFERLYPSRESGNWM